MSSERDALLADAKRLETDMAAMARCIVLLDPSRSPRPGRTHAGRPPGKGKGPPDITFEHGEFTTLVLSALRDAPHPLDSTELGERVVRAKGHDPATLCMTPVSTKLFSTVNNLVKRGRVQRMDQGPRPCWRVAR